MWERLKEEFNRRPLSYRGLMRLTALGIAGEFVLMGGVVTLVVLNNTPDRVVSATPEYPRVQEENDLYRLARLAPTLVRVTLKNEPATEEQRDVLWRDIFKSLQSDRPSACQWSLTGKVHENPSSYIAACLSY